MEEAELRWSRATLMMAFVFIILALDFAASVPQPRWTLSSGLMIVVVLLSFVPFLLSEILKQKKEKSHLVLIGVFGGSLLQVVAFIISLVTGSSWLFVTAATGIYVFLASMDMLPSRRDFIWLALLIALVSFTGYLVPLLSSMSLDPLLVELTGAFIGLLGAITLGELFKAREDRRSAENLSYQILDELVRVEESPTDTPTQRVPTPIWLAGIHSGLILSLRDDFRKQCVDVHVAIAQHNDQPTHFSADKILEKINGLNTKDYL